MPNKLNQGYLPDPSNILTHISDSSSSKSVLHRTDCNNKQLHENLPWYHITNNNSVYDNTVMFIQTYCLKSY